MNNIKITRNLINSMHVKSVLQLKPQKTLPKYLIYFDRKKDNYTLLSSSSGQILGKMNARPEYIFDKHTYYPNLRGYSSLYIGSLKSEIRRHGIGRTLINFAKLESVRRGCEGRIHLIAKNVTKEQDNPPIVAYRKMGFDSQYRWAIANADRYIKTGIEQSTMSNTSIPMYLPVKNYCAKFNKYCTKLFSNNKQV